MVLGFKTLIGNRPTYFVQKILACSVELYKKSFKPKIHTIRKGNRWKAGYFIHMATGVRTEHYNQFNAGIVGLDICKSVQEIKIVHSKFHGDKGFDKGIWVIVDDNGLSDFWVKELAINDGFNDVEAFFEYFNEDFEGQIIHWTDKKY